jgi:hypothetical protein
MDTFQKRQKEMKRLEKQREKEARRQQRKQSGGLTAIEEAAEPDPNAEPAPDPDSNKS